MLYLRNPHHPNIVRNCTGSFSDNRIIPGNNQRSGFADVEFKACELLPKILSDPGLSPQLEFHQVDAISFHPIPKFAR